MDNPCPDIFELEQLADGAMEGGPTGRIGTHLAGCASCRDRLSDIKENLELIAPMNRVMTRLKISPSSFGMPEFIGEYRIVREIGRGGMGIVYEAEQRDPKRAVAVKVLHAGLGVDARLERMFRREVHVLGRLRHPGIAAIHEAGRAADGRAFFAMELVQGSALTAFVRAKRPPLQQRLGLFQRVCEAIAYAHQRGVIHRDLKPSNILVDAGGDPKVLDFGLAKIFELEEGGTPVTAVTEEGRIQGTLPYMSPEQVRGDPAEVDVRSDIYSLGVVLYELLTGRLPYSIERRSLPEAARTICEQAPAALSSIDRDLRGDLETIVRKALEKEPGQRYSSAAALAEDIGRLLANQPILARPPTMTYQLRKLVARHKVPFVLLAAIVALATGSAIVTGVLYARASTNLTRAREAEARADADARRARHEAEVATTIKDFLMATFRVSDPEVGQGTTVSARQLLDRAAERVRKYQGVDEEVQASIMHTIGSVYANLGLYVEAASLLREALTLRHAKDPTSTEVADTASELADILRRTGDEEGARTLFEAAVTIMKRRGREDDFHILMLLQNLAELRAQQGDLLGAEAACREIIAAMRKSANGEIGLPAALNTLAGVLAELGRYEEAVSVQEEAIQRLAATKHVGPVTVLKYRGNFAWLLALAGRLDEAEPLIREVLAERRRVLPPRHLEIATSLVTLGVVCLKRERADEAEPLFQEALSIRRDALGENALPVAEVMGFLGECFVELGRFDDADKSLRESYEQMRRSPEAHSLIRREGAERLAKLYERWGRAEMAAEWRRRAADGAGL
ncbi:MAG TPA: tetratricopeptide repeat protein [Phycisphaerae bacterium]|nr:tetratricopeptide repeat protein [Phycisphaerae bacterium]